MYATQRARPKPGHIMDQQMSLITRQICLLEHLVLHVVHPAALNIHTVLTYCNVHVVKDLTGH